MRRLALFGLEDACLGGLRLLALGNLLFSNIGIDKPKPTRIWKIALRQIQNTVSRPRGRPPIRCDDDTRDLNIEAARQEFRANGYKERLGYVFSISFALQILLAPMIASASQISGNN
jgi:hypothetical protein